MWITNFNTNKKFRFYDTTFCLFGTDKSIKKLNKLKDVSWQLLVRDSVVVNTPGWYSGGPGSNPHPELDAHHSGGKGS